MITAMSSLIGSSLSHRLKPALIAIALSFLAISCAGNSHLYLLPALGLNLITIMASRELHSILTLIGIKSFWPVNVAAALIPQITLGALNSSDSSSMVIGLFLSLLLPLLWLMKSLKKDQSMVTIFFHALYLGAPIMLLYSKVLPQPATNLGQNQLELLLLLGVVKGTDIGGYFIGKIWGKNRLCPSISPGKTWEGALGGVLFAQVFGYAICCLAPLLGAYIPFSLWLSMTFTVLSVSAQVGDLIESYIKRLAGVKDSGSLPGLGGILDMLDSLLVSVAVFWILKQIAWL